jgi:hypothetical protein
MTRENKIDKSLENYWEKNKQFDQAPSSTQ